MKKLLLEIELVPEKCFFSNIRSVLSKSQWTILSRQIRSTAYDICQICGASEKQPLHAHEIWSYNDLEKIQKLEGMIALCVDCHSVKHMGFANLQGKGDIAFKHFMIINELSFQQAQKYIEEAFTTWNIRSQYSWKCDISYLKTYGINILKLKRGETSK